MVRKKSTKSLSGRGVLTVRRIGNTKALHQDHNWHLPGTVRRLAWLEQVSKVKERTLQSFKKKNDTIWLLCLKYHSDCHIDDGLKGAKETGRLRGDCNTQAKRWWMAWTRVNFYCYSKCLWLIDYMLNKKMNKFLTNIQFPSVEKCIPDILSVRVRKL